MPVVLMLLQLALVGQPPASAEGEQMSAHCVGTDEPETSSTHSG
jgi:hypothetical protein